MGLGVVLLAYPSGMGTVPGQAAGTSAPEAARHLTSPREALLLLVGHLGAVAKGPRLLVVLKTFILRFAFLLLK